MKNILKNMPTHLKNKSATLLKSPFNAISASSFTYYTVLRTHIKLINIGLDRWIDFIGTERLAFSVAMVHHKNYNNSIILIS